MRKRILASGLIAWPAAMALAQQAPPAGTTAAPSSGYVTREEYNKLQAKLDSVIQEMDRQKQAQKTSQAELDQTIDEIEKDIANNHKLIDDVHLGENKFVIAGDADIGLVVPEHGPSTFEAGFAPLFLWELDKNLLFEGALDIAGETLEDDTSDTTVDLVLANLTYTVNDNLYVGGGVFAVPFGRYHTHFDPSWINKLPDDPLVFGDRALGPSSETGVFAGGSAPVSSTKIEYNVYVANGPNLNISDPDNAGTLNFDDFTDLNGNKAVGGRIGWLPIAEVDVGYSIQYSKPAPQGSGFEDVNALLQAVDAQYKAQIEQIKGTLEVRAEWIFSKVEDATYDVGAGPFTFDNNRNGGYVQLSYRPTLVGNRVLRNFEPVVRYDTIKVSSDAPGGGNENRYTFGLDYWVRPNVVLKTAYQIDNPSEGEDQNTFFFQCGIGL